MALNLVTQCAIAECTKPSKVRGLCRAHYIKKWREGALPVKPMEEVLVRVRFGLHRADDRSMRRLSHLTGHTLAELLRKAVKEFLARSTKVKVVEVGVTDGRSETPAAHTSAH